MFALVLIGLIGIFSYSMGNVAAAPGDTIYINGSSGQDNWDGQLAVWNGPKTTIKNATGTVNNGGTVNIANGLYTGVNNTNININRNMIIVGQSSDGTIINGNTSTIFIIASGVNFNIFNLTLINTKSGNNGGGILNYGTLTLTNCKFINNTASNNGGAIYSGQEILPVNNCTFINNTASNNGGAISGGDTVNNCIFTNNTAGNNCGAMSGIIVTNYTFIHNTASSNTGGAIECSYGSNLNVINSTFINNTARSGGAICNFGTTEANFNRIIGNTATNGNDICSDLGSTNADNNWWGLNNGPSTGSIDGLTVFKWLVLSCTENNSIIIGSDQ
jgi:predicted outer membrane repeat protein